jgi:HD-like signal output (HDOD) protein
MTSVRQAVGYLGVELLKALVLSVHVFTTMETGPPIEFSLERLQLHSLLTGRLARRFLKDPKQSEAAFAAGILHEIGKAILAMSLPERFSEIVTAVRLERRCFHLVELEVIGVTHAEIGAYLLGVWGLPFPIVEAVANHHLPGRVTEGSTDVLVAVHAAETLAALSDPDPDDPLSEAELDVASIERAGFGGDLPLWRELAEVSVEEHRRAG